MGSQSESRYVSSIAMLLALAIFVWSKIDAIDWWPDFPHKQIPKNIFECQPDT